MSQFLAVFLDQPPSFLVPLSHDLTQLWHVEVSGFKKTSVASTT